MKRQATVKGNKIVAIAKAGKYEVIFTDAFKTYDKMYADNIFGVGMIAHEMADNNDIGRELARKIVNALHK